MQKSNGSSALYLIILFAIVSIIGGSYYFINYRQATSQPLLPSPLPMPTASPDDSKAKLDDLEHFTGIVKTGEEIGEGRNYCPKAYYVTGGQQPVQLRNRSDISGKLNLFSDDSYLNKKVEVSGTTPHILCDALMCECDYHVTISSIKVVE